MVLNTEIIINDYQKFCLFPLFLVQTSKTEFHWIIEQDDKKN